MFTCLRLATVGCSKGISMSIGSPPPTHIASTHQPLHAAWSPPLLLVLRAKKALVEAQANVEKVGATHDVSLPPFFSAFTQ